MYSKLLFEDSLKSVIHCPQGMDGAKFNLIPRKICYSEVLSERGRIHSKPIFVINIQVWIPITVTLQSHLQKFSFDFSFVALHMELWVEEFHMTEDY